MEPIHLSSTPYIFLSIPGEVAASTHEANKANGGWGPPEKRRVWPASLARC